jgi:uncharacterized membrane-anchored protein
MRPIAILFSSLLTIGSLLAQEGKAPPPPQPGDPGTAERPQDPDQAEKPVKLKEQLAKFHPKEGTVEVGSMARVKLPAGWLFLSGADGHGFLTALGNDPGPSVLGVALPPDFDTSHTFAVYSYVGEGHVDDSETPDYDALLADMKESTAEQSKARQKVGRGKVELLGWAEPPHYDKTQHKLYWAEKLKFGDTDGLTLNYNVRVLGRAGHLVVNGVGDVDQLRLVDQRNQELLAVTEFVEGQRYENFDPKYDKLAEYGIGGLIAGGIALKLGLFAKLGVLLKVAIKPIIIGVVLIGGFLARMLGMKKKQKEAGGAAT